MITFAISALGVGEASLASSFKGDDDINCYGPSPFAIYFLLCI